MKRKEIAVWLEENDRHISTHNNKNGWCGYYYTTPNDFDYTGYVSFRVELYQIPDIQLNCIQL